MNGESNDQSISVVADDAGTGRVSRRKREPKAVAPAASFLELIERASKDPAVDIIKMEQLLGMMERVNLRQSIADFSIAMNAAQAEILPVLTDRDNTHTNSRYASFDALDRKLRPIYTKHGFSLSYDTEPAEHPSVVRVVCRVAHRGGHSHDYKIDMPADGKGAKGGDVMTLTHATGSAIQYGRRYLLRMIFNVSTVDQYADDDGNAAGTVYITGNEAADLRAMASELGANIPAYLAVLKVDDFERIPASKYKTALATLEAKRNRA